MNITAANTTYHQDHIHTDINILILGAGMSGLELAKYLSQRDAKNVVVIDVGPADDCCHINAGEEFQYADKFWKNEEYDRYAYRPWHSLSEPHFSKGSCLRRRVGGRSLYWHGVILPIEAAALKFWPSQIVSDLTESWQGGPPLYSQVQSEILAWAGKYHDTNTVFKFAGFEFKITPQATRNVDSLGRWEAYSPLSFWHEAEQTKHLPPIISGYEAISLITQNGHCTGAKLRNVTSNEIHHVFANKCVLALGTIENTRLAAQELYNTGHLIEKKMTGLVDHIVQGFNVTLEFQKVPVMLKALLENHPDSIFYSPSRSGERFNLFFTLSQSSFGVELEVWTMGEQVPSEKGYIKVEEYDDVAPLLISCTLSHEDNELIHREQDELNLFWYKLCQQIKIPFSPLAFDGGFSVHARTMGDVYYEFHSPSRTVNYHVPVTWISPLGTENHESSTLPLGEILDEQHQFNDINNLYAVGPSAFPRPGAANPSLTTLALSRRLAAILS